MRYHTVGESDVLWASKLVRRLGPTNESDLICMELFVSFCSNLAIRTVTDEF